MARYACRPIPPRPEGRGFSGFPVMPRYEGRGAIVRRLAAVLRYTATSRGNPDPKVIARGLGCHWRTVQRDLDALREAGWMERRETSWN